MVRFGRLLLGTSLIALSGMWLELALTRIFAVLFFYNYVFVILTVAVLGMSFGAAAVHQFGPRLPRALGTPGLTAGLAALAVLVLAVATVTPMPIDGRFLLTGAALAPYLCMGAALAAIFMAHAQESPRLYWADLLGAGLGALSAIPLFNLAGPLLALPIVAALLSGAALVLTGQVARPRWATGLALAGLGGALILAWMGPDIDLAQLTTQKPATRLLQTMPGAQIVHTDWDAFARVDVVASPASADRQQVFIDGAAGSIMPAYPVDAAAASNWTADIGYFPFRAQPESVFVIGPGGGKDVLFGLLAQSKMIAGAEVSPAVVRTVQQFGDMNGDLYDRPVVAISVDEGRSALERRDDRYELIYLSEVVSLNAERRGLVLAENYVFTVEALQTYLDHLAPGGQLAFKLYDELTLTRAFVTAVRALSERGVDEAAAARHLAVLLDPGLLSSESPLRSPLLLVYGEPITPQMAADLLDDVQAAGLAPLYVPYLYERPPLSELATGQTTLDELVADFTRADISPTTDNRPFFYEFRHGLPETLRQLLLILGAVALLGVAYLWWRSRHFHGPYWSFTLYFGLLGAGFLAAELAIIQNLTLFLGHPTTALAVCLGTILIAAGLGSAAAGRLGRGREGHLAMYAAGSGALLLVVFLLIVGPLTHALLGTSLPIRIGVTVVIVAPIFFLLGMPFPLGLRMAAMQLGSPMIPLAWAINGLASAIGSTGLLALALLWGFDAVLVAVALGYALVAILIGRTSRG